MATTAVGEEGRESDNSADTQAGEEGGLQWVTGGSSVPVLVWRNEMDVVG